MVTKILYQMKKVYYLIFLSFIISSCNLGDMQVKGIISDRVLENSKGYFELTDFQKISGLKKTVDGVEYYTIKYNATVKALKSGGWVYIKNDSNELVFSSTVEENIEDFSFGDILKGFGTSHAEELKAGKLYNYEKSTTLIKYEEGWKIYF